MKVPPEEDDIPVGAKRLKIDLSKICKEAVQHKGRLKKLLEVDHIVICAGQLSEQSLCNALDAYKLPYTLIGGALKAGEVDAKRAIAEGLKAALSV